MRDRLMELIQNAPRTDTVYGDIKLAEPVQTLQTIADHLLANGVIVPPCKVGDTVYICTCFGFWYTKPEINKCEMQIKSIRVTESRMVFEAEHGKDNVDYFELKTSAKPSFSPMRKQKKHLRKGARDERDRIPRKAQG